MWLRRMTGAAATLLLASGVAAGTESSATGADHHGGSGPVNGRIFFSTGFILPNPDTVGTTPQVYSVRPDGSALRQLTHVARRGRRPARRASRPTAGRSPT